MLDIQEKHLCQNCHAHLSGLKLPAIARLLESSAGPIHEIWSLYPYDGMAKKLIGEIKFSSKRWLLSVFTADLKETALMLTALKSYDLVIPIPMDRSKRIQREFHAVHLLAKTVSSTCSIPCLAHVLIKHRRTLAQSALTREERLVNPQGAFKVRKDARLKNARVLLIDDVLTTGATTQEAARALKTAGAGRVDLLTLARTELGNPSRSFAGHSESFVCHPERSEVSQNRDAFPPQDEIMLLEKRVQK